MLRLFTFCTIVAAFGLTLRPDVASAQLTAQTLIGYAVDEVGPKHLDVDRAIERFRRGDIKGTREALDAARKKDPQLPPTALTLAKLYLAANKATPARTTIERFVKDNPDDPEPYVIFGEQAFAGGRITDAEQLFVRAGEKLSGFDENPLRKKNLQTRALAGLASVDEWRQDWDGALAHLANWLKIDSENGAAWLRSGRAKFMKGDYKAARADFAKAARYADNLPGADATLGQLFEQSDKHDEAVKAMRQALAGAGDDNNTKLAVARWMLSTSQASGAKKILDGLIKSDPNTADVRLLAGVADLMSGEENSALEHLKIAYQLAPGNFDVANQLALLLVGEDDETQRAQAVEIAEKNAQANQANPQALISLGWIYYQRGRSADAQKLFQAAVQRGAVSTTIPDGAYFLARFAYERGQNEGAEKLLESSLKTNRIFVHRSDAEALLRKIQKP